MMGKTAVITQSNYLPWKGYFSQIVLADYLIFLDDVQYTKRDWRNRNQIKTSEGLKWITVPVKSTRDSKISDVIIDSNKWQEKHWKMIYHSYSKSKYFQLFSEYFEKIYTNSTWEYLSELNQYLVKMITNEILGIETVFYKSSELNNSGKKLEKILNILESLEDVSNYLTGPAAKNYIRGFEDEFITRDIKLHYMNYSDFPMYNQLFGAYEHNVSIIDVIFNTGIESLNNIINPFMREYERKNTI